MQPTLRFVCTTQLGRCAEINLMSHPAERFDAPRSIVKGTPLKFLISRYLVSLIAESFAGAWSDFDQARFATNANAGLETLELSERGRQVGAAIQSCLPESFEHALPIFLDALGPEIGDTEEIGLKPFFYFPHSHYVTQSATETINAGLEACYHLTKRFTAEFCIRPLITRDPQKVMARLHHWLDDPDCHVRRLISEGTRPRLPWASRLSIFIDEPDPVLELLNHLKYDSSLYVRRSVANNLGDIAKDHTDLVLNTCENWLENSWSEDQTDGDNLRWIIRHALRHPDKKGNRRAKTLRERAGLRSKSTTSAST